MEFVSRLPRQSQVQQEEKLEKKSKSSKKSKEKKEKKTHKVKKDKSEISKKEQTQSEIQLDDNFVLRATSDMLPPDILDLTEESLFNEWGQMRKWVNGELAESLISQRYNEIELNLAQLQSLKNSVAQDTKVSLYKYGIGEDQGTTLGFEDFLYYGIPRVQVYGIPEEKKEFGVFDDNTEMYLRI